MKESTKIRLKEEGYKLFLVIKYLLKHPFYEIKNLFSGYYNSALVFWFTSILFFYMWLNNILGKPLKVMGILAILTYIYMFTKSEKWKEYYEKEMIKGNGL